MAEAPKDLNRRGITTLSIGHACVDICQGAVPAMLPFLIHDHGYSYSQATALLLVMTFTSSLIQPLFGFLADKRSLSWLLPAGIACAGVGIAGAGFAGSFEVTLLAIALSGLGVGAYHPEGARYANYVSGDQRSAGMSFYSVGGNIGFALGPILVTPLILLLGFSGIAWILVPLTAGALLLAFSLPWLGTFRPEHQAAKTKGEAESTPDRWWPFAGVAGIAGFRSAAYFGMQAFVPLYFISHWDASTALGNTALTVLLVFGAVGTIAGGQLADRVGKKMIMMVSLGVLAPLILLFMVSNEAAGIVLMAAIGFFMVGTFAITVVLGQDFLPNRIGVASGVTLGAAIGFGGFVAYLLGILADHTSVTTVMFVIAALPLPAFLISLVLPEPVEEKVAEAWPEGQTA